MFRFNTLFAAAASLVLFFGVATLAQDKNETELRGIYAKLDVALKARDANKLTAYYDEKYTLESDGKKLKKSEAIDQWKQVLGFITSVDKLQTTIGKVRAAGDTYVVDYSQTSSGKVQFPDSPLTTFQYSGNVTDTWLHTKDGRWVTMSSVEHSSDFKVNGQSMKAPNE